LIALADDATDAVAGRSQADDRRHLAVHVLCLLLLPLVQLAINPALFINPGGNSVVDPWVYTGFFLSLPSHLHRFGVTYYSSRLSWLLPGYAAQKLFSPLAGNYALHLAFFYALLAATYTLMASGASRTVAIVATMLVAWSPAILVALSWDYVDGAGIVFLVVTLCCLERAARGGGRRWLWSMGAGAGIVSLIASNLTLAALVPACVVFLIARLEAPRWRSTAVILAVAGAGAAVALVVFGYFNWRLVGSWLFLESSVRFWLKIRHALGQWSVPNFKWREATWLALPIFATFGAILSLAGRRATSSFARAAQLVLVAAVATWLLIDAVSQSALFRYSYYTSYLAPLALIALPLQGLVLPPDAGRRSIVLFEVATMAVLAGGHALILAYALPFWRFWAMLLARPGTTQLVVMTFVMTAAGAVAVLGLRYVERPARRWAVFVLGMAMSFSGMSTYWPNRNLPNPRTEFRSTAFAHRFITANVGDRTVRIWSVPPSYWSPPFRSIAGTYLWGWVLVNEDLPRLTEQEAVSFEPATRLVMLVNRDADAEDAVASMRARGLDFVNARRAEFEEPARRFLVIVGDVVRADAHASTRQAKR
jgi:hypothetical protein